MFVLLDFFTGGPTRVSTNRVVYVRRRDNYLVEIHLDNKVVELVRAQRDLPFCDWLKEALGELV